MTSKDINAYYLVFLLAFAPFSSFFTSVSAGARDFSLVILRFLKFFLVSISITVRAGFSNTSCFYKGQLISNCSFGVFKSPIKQQNIFQDFCPSQIKKIRALFTTNSRILFWLSYTTFLIWTIFRGKGRNPGKNFVDFLEDLITQKGYFEINWPLGLGLRVLDFSTTGLTTGCSKAMSILPSTSIMYWTRDLTSFYKLIKKGISLKNIKKISKTFSFKKYHNHMTWKCVVGC